MAVAVPRREEGAVVPSPVMAAEAATLGADDVLARLRTGAGGLPADEAARRLRVTGPNAVRSHQVHAWSLLASQLRSPLLILLAVTALASAFLGQSSDAIIIGVILAASVGMGFVNEYKAAKTAEALHSSVRHSCVALRDGHPRTMGSRPGSGSGCGSCTSWWRGASGCSAPRPTGAASRSSPTSAGSSSGC